MKILFWMIVLTTFAFADDTGWLSASNINSTAGSPVNGDSVYATDDEYADFTSITSTVRWDGFGASVSGTVDSIIVRQEILASGNSPGSRLGTVRFHEDGTELGDTENVAPVKNSEIYYETRGTTDNSFGITPTPTMVNATTFGYKYTSSSTSGSRLLDHVQLIIYYTPPGGAPTPTRRRQLLQRQLHGSTQDYETFTKGLKSCVVSFAH